MERHGGVSSCTLTFLHPEWPKVYVVLVVLSAVRLKTVFLCLFQFVVPMLTAAREELVLLFLVFVSGLESKLFECKYWLVC